MRDGQKDEEEAAPGPDKVRCGQVAEGDRDCELKKDKRRLVGSNVDAQKNRDTKPCTNPSRRWGSCSFYLPRQGSLLIFQEKERSPQSDIEKGLNDACLLKEEPGGSAAQERI